MENKYVFTSSGILEGPEDWFNLILPENFTDSYDELFEGKYIIPSEEQIAFYKNHKDYDLYHQFYMIEYTDEDKENAKQAENEEIKLRRKNDYKNTVDPLYMAYVKNQALGNTEKATSYYNQWLEAVQQIKEENPYIV